MKVCILGTGDVGRTLGAGLAGRGHEVMVGTRDPGAEKMRSWAEETGHGVKVGTFADASAWGEMIVLAVGWAHTEGVLDMAGRTNFAGKVVVDAVNPVQVEDGKPGLAIGHTDSAGEQIQRWLPGAKVVKAFNTVGYAHMVDPSFPDGAPDMFICGDDEQAKKATAGLIEALGWAPPIDLGGIVQSRLLEPLAMIWITHLVNNQFNPNHAFKLLRK